MQGPEIVVNTLSASKIKDASGYVWQYNSRSDSHSKIACWAALVSLALMTWSLVDPRPIPVVVAMSAGQLLGTVSLLAFLTVVVADLRQRLRAP